MFCGTPGYVPTEGEREEGAPQPLPRPRMTPEEIQAARGQAKLDAISEIVWEIRERIQDKRDQREAREAQERTEAAQDAAHHVAEEGGVLGSPEPQPETPSAPEPGPAGTRTPAVRPRRPRTVA